MGIKKILIERLVNAWGEDQRSRLEGLPLVDLVLDEYNLADDFYINEHPQYTLDMFGADPNFMVWTDADGEEWIVVKNDAGEKLVYWQWVEWQIGKNGEEPFRNVLPLEDYGLPF